MNCKKSQCALNLPLNSLNLLIYVFVMKFKVVEIFFLFLAFSFFTRAVSKRPNIVFFLTDDQTSSTLGCYGHPLAKTPNIDGLAARGARFANAFVSQSICWVSRTTILTGLTGRTFGVYGVHDLAKPEAVEKLYVDYLREAGYRTGFVGKWHAKMPDGWKAEDHFDFFERIGRNPYYKKQKDGSLRHETDLIVDRGIEFLKSQSRDQPFAMNMWFNACHAEDSDRRPGIGHFPWPFVVNGMYGEYRMPPPRLNDSKIFDELPLFLKNTINRERFFWRWNSNSKYQINLRAYLRMVSGIDNAIGRFLEALEVRGFAENTIIVYSADNGFHMGNRGLAGKWSHYEESLRVPMVICDPRVSEEAKGQVLDESVLNLDLPCTFLKWANLEIPEKYQGRSLDRLVAGESSEAWREYTFHEHFAVRQRIPAFESLRGKRFKYARYVDQGNYEFLHDLREDPDELINLATEPKFQKTLLKIRKATDLRVNQLGGPLAPPKSPLEVSSSPYPASAAAVANRPGSNGFSNLIPSGNLIRSWSGDPAIWSLKDGVLIARTDGTQTMNQFLTWKVTTVRNFDLRLRIRVSNGANSGIQYRSVHRPDLGIDVVSGYQCDVVADKPQYNGMLYEEKGRGILCRAGQKVIVDPKGKPWLIKESELRDFPSGKWHEYRILVKGNHHRHWINGHPTADLIDFHEKGRAFDGVLALQAHKGPPMTLEFKDMRIRHLPDDLPLLTFEDYPVPAKGVVESSSKKQNKNQQSPKY